jgi:phospholipase A2
MDLYSVFTTGWIFLQDDPAAHPGGSAHKEVAGFQRTWHKFSSAREYVDNGTEPLPIITAIRHERPWKDWSDKENPFKEPNHSSTEHAEASRAWFQWFEFTPYEVGCDEIQAWVPVWGFGRPFEQGRSTMQLPEQSLALLLGLATSAPAGPLTSYLSTISRNLSLGFLGDSVHRLARAVTKLWGKEGTEEFQNHHPLHACNEHNFMYHYTAVQPGEARPPGLENSPRIHLIDSGMDNNCPTMVLLHPQRQCDVIINMDASSDVQKDSFQERVDQIGSRRGLKFTKRHSVTRGENPKDPDRFNGLYAQIYDGKPCPRPATVQDSYGRTVTNPPAPTFEQECTMVYMPILPNERAVPDFDPSTAKFSGSYNLVWTPEQVEVLVKVCRANCRDGGSVLKEVLHEAWLRKKAERERRSLVMQHL